MSQPAGGRMYHASQFRRPGDFPYFHHPNGSQRYNPHRSVQVYSITRYSAQNRGGRGGRGGGGFGSTRGRPFNNFYRPRNGYLDSDLEWDNYDIGTNKSSRGRRNRQCGRDAYYRIGSSFSSSDSELEWDDYDLRSKKEAEAAGSGSLEIYVTEEFVPLISATDSGSLSRGHIPLGAIQVRKLPQGSGDPGILLKGGDFSVGKELLFLTSEVNNNGGEEGTVSVTGSFDETLVRLQDFLVQSGLETTTTRSHELLKRQSSDSSQKTDKSPESDAPAESLSSESDVLLEEEYEPNYQDKLADSDLYALLPPDLDSPDSLLSRSLADLTDQTLYEEYGLETRRRDGKEVEDRDKFIDAKDKRKAAAKAKRRKRDKRGESDSSLGETDDNRKGKRQAPNFFVAIQVSDQEVLESLKAVQHSVLEGDEKLKDAMVPIATLHLTVMVMHLSSEEEISKAKAALKDCQQILGPKFSKETLVIEFHGLGHFNNQVMFAKIKDSGNTVQALYEIADIVEKCYQKYGITSTGERGFKPHLTVMKLSRAPSLRKKGVRRIKSELYKAHSNKLFGSQVMTGLQLCSINKTKGIDGYFYKASEFFFANYGPLEIIKENEISEDMRQDEQKAEKSCEDDQSSRPGKSSQNEEDSTIKKNGSQESTNDDKRDDGGEGTTEDGRNQ
ncbi:A-kinase anchor protein 7 isoforms delta and gamma [Holothuria leucospilota]|uniref:A-kinase anchor protein 7 isoforms delta and gamma n=1 Tax=Holothuria leucospilota TaxID=206669 RepID=A0A9Q1H5W7_HOLLE|nr:A-kinase anchor protein 7 isoforms delta and gamma [Holothuria leucospilota]